MSWLTILALAASALAAAIFALRLPRASWALFAAALLFGLAGYALQGSPAQPAAPAAPTDADAAETGELIVAARREFYGAGIQPSRYVVSADAFARRGQWQDAAAFLGNALAENPNDSEAWLALANALVEHAGGRLTPAALEAYNRAQILAGDNPAPTYFYGFALLRQGEAAKTRALWAGLVDQAPADAPWKPAMAERLARLDAMIAEMGGPPAPAARQAEPPAADSDAPPR